MTSSSVNPAPCSRCYRCSLGPSFLTETPTAVDLNYPCPEPMHHDAVLCITHALARLHSHQLRDPADTSTADPTDPPQHLNHNDPDCNIMKIHHCHLTCLCTHYACCAGQLRGWSSDMTKIKHLHHPKRREETLGHECT